jgi:hypothetical protein
MYKFHEDDNEDANHQRFGNDCESMTLPTGRNQGDPEGH